MSDSDRRVAAGVLAATAVAAVARFAALGHRVAHWDEARVGYWVLRYAETGHYSYQPIIHGPFLFVVNSHVFDVFGASDASMRAVVALVSAALPLTAWLLRERLKPAETVSLALLLAANPLVLYYSRFMRNDVLVAAFAFAAFAFFVRASDTGRRRHCYAGALSLALAFTTKENALVYVACWAGACVLLLDWVLLAAVAEGRDPTAELRSRARVTLDGLRPWGPDILGSLAAFALVVVFFYAPRPALYRLPANPGTLPAVVSAATAGALSKFANTWVGGHPHSYVSYLVSDVHALAAGAAVLCVLGVAGFVHDRYAGARPRPVVSFAGYWAAASLVIYPAVTDVSAAWTMVHVVVPLAVPAAVGGGLLVSTVAATRRAEDRIGTVIAVLLVFAVVGWVAYTGAVTSFVAPQSPGPLVQYGQPSGHLHGVLDEADAAVESPHGGGPDVLYYGDHFYAGNDPSAAPNASFYEPKHWLWRMPLPWYFERMGARTAAADQPSALNGTRAPVVVTTAANYGTVAPRLQGYHAETYDLTSTGTPTVFFVKNATART